MKSVWFVLYDIHIQCVVCTMYCMLHTVRVYYMLVRRRCQKSHSRSHSHSRSRWYWCRGWGLRVTCYHTTSWHALYRVASHGTPSSPSKSPITFFQPPPKVLCLYSFSTMKTPAFHPQLSPSSSWLANSYLDDWAYDMAYSISYIVYVI